MKSPKEQKSHAALKSSAKTLIWKHGFSRVTVEEICSLAGISKMTFYRHFKNKNELILLILKETFEQGLSEYQSIMDSELAFTEKIRQVVLLKFKDTINLSIELINDIYRKEETELQKCIEEYSVKSTDLFLFDLMQAQKDNFIRKELKPEFIIYMLEDMNTKMMDSRLIEMHSNPQELIMELINFFFYGITQNPV